MYTGYATQPTTMSVARVYFSVGDIVFVAGPTITDAFRFGTTQAVGIVDKRDTLDRNMMWVLIIFKGFSVLLMNKIKWNEMISFLTDFFLRNFFFRSTYTNE